MTIRSGGLSDYALRPCSAKPATHTTLRSSSLRSTRGEEESATHSTREAPYSFEFNTPLGKVAFNGKNEDNTYNAKDYCLIIDLSGNDTYNGPAAASYSLEHPISIIMDF